MWKKSLLSLATVTLLAACASTKPAKPTTPPVAPTTANTTMPAADNHAAKLDPLKDPNNILSTRSVFFDFNKSAPKAAAKPVIEAHAMYLKDHAARKVQLQGNTDARGSREYNLALGQRRSESVKSMMRVLGVKDSQLEAISYGKEKPRATGTTDADYAEDRRVDIVYNGE